MNSENSREFWGILRKGILGNSKGFEGILGDSKEF